MRGKVIVLVGLVAILALFSVTSRGKDGTILSTSETISFPEHITHQGLNCVKGDLQNRKTKIDKVAHYNCLAKDSTSSSFPKAGVLMFSDQTLLEIQTEPTGSWLEYQEYSKDLYQLTDNLYATDVFSGGAHCCQTLLIIDASKEKIIDAIDGYSSSFDFTSRNGAPIVSTHYGAFEYALSSYAQSIRPKIYYQVNESGVTQYKLPPDLFFQEKESILSLAIPAESKIKDRANLCEDYFSNGDCSSVSDQGRKVSAVVGLYLLNNDTQGAENYFYTFADKTDSNISLFEQISKLVGVIEPDREYKRNIWEKIPINSENGAIDYMKVVMSSQLQENWPAKCVNLISDTYSQDSNYWVVETHSIQQGNSACPGDPNVSPRLATFIVNKTTGEIKYYDITGKFIPFVQYLYSLDTTPGDG